MSDKETCGDFEIYKNEGNLWIVKDTRDNKIIGKFQNKEDALEKIAVFLQDNEERLESESTC
ncbi:MAG: hypothetical protein ACFFDS_08800 [Candidatus Thorarchaeota archaeon]